jgi:hypothetical protein
VKKDVLLWAALLAALAVTASAEYELARAAGFGVYVAGGVPAALDVYAVRALRARRDVAAVVVAMVAVQAAAHLVAAGLLAVSVPLVVAVSSIAPLVLWRVHTLAGDVSTPPPHPVEVDTPPALDVPAPIVPAVVEPLVICGAHRVYALAVHPDDEPGEVIGRLDPERARMLIEHAWASGLSLREAARVSTRSPSYASKVYTALDRENAAAPERPALEAVTA